jgi:hypothetical protein
MKDDNNNTVFAKIGPFFEMGRPSWAGVANIR